MCEVQRINTGEKVWLPWSCDYCGANVSGKYRDCPNCGRPRGKNTTFDVTKPGETLTEEEVSKRCGPDWLCECCDSLNSASLSECPSCGAPKGASKNYFELKRIREESVRAEADKVESVEQSSVVPAIYDDDDKKEEEKRFTGEYLEDYTEKYRSIPVVGNDMPYRRRKRNKSFNFMKVIAVAMTVAGSIGLLSVLICALLPKEYSATVTDVSWERSINIEQQDTYHESGWSIPAGGRETSKEWKKSGTKKVIDHYDTRDVTKTKVVDDGYDITYDYVDNGDGSADKIEVRTPKTKTVTYTEKEEYPVYVDVDVYDWYYYYDIDRWKHHHYIETSGKTAPYWGEVELANKQREGGRTETYYIYVTGEDTKDKYTVKYDDWCKISLGDEITLKASIIGDAVITEINGVKLVE